MKILYGHYELNMTCDEYDVFLQYLRDHVGCILGFGLSGIPIYTLDEYNASSSVGFALLGNSTKTEIIGVAYKTSELSRVWVIPVADGKHALFIDGMPTIVSELGLNYDDKTKVVTCPAHNNKVVISNFS